MEMQVMISASSNKLFFFFSCALFFLVVLFRLTHNNCVTDIVLNSIQLKRHLLKVMNRNPHEFRKLIIKGSEKSCNCVLICKLINSTLLDWLMNVISSTTQRINFFLLFFSFIVDWKQERSVHKRAKMIVQKFKCKKYVAFKTFSSYVLTCSLS